VIGLRAAIEVTGGHLELPGRMTREEVAAALVAIGDYGGDEEVDAQAALRAVPDREAVIMAGGLRVRDTATGVQVEPGCCFGLEEWRSWQDLLGFPELVREWAPHGLGEQLADAFDEHFHISAPL
jgi:hypothetical protein